MKKYGVILYVETDNFGDDIQTYAASRLLPHVDYVIDRENMDSFESDNHEPVYCIFNGWFLYNIVNWPPSKDIIPLPISMHFTDTMSNYHASKELFKKRLYNYFNYFSKFGVGCRDSSTLNLFLKDMSHAYLSYCVTLTLEKFKIKEPKEDYICIVDVSDKVRDYVYKYANCEIKEYTHDYRNKTFENIPFEERMKNVEERLRIYQNARCIVTSRYHAAMPCLALGTPAALIPSSYEPNRYADLEGLLRVCSEEEFIGGEVLDINNPTNNSEDYKKIEKQLRNKVNEFINSDYNIEPYNEITPSNELKKSLKQLEKFYSDNKNLKRIVWANNYMENKNNVNNIEIKNKNKEIDKLINKNKELSDKYNRTINSRSWKITSIYRKVGSFIKRLIK